MESGWSFWPFDDGEWSERGRVADGENFSCPPSIHATKSGEPFEHPLGEHFALCDDAPP